MEPHLKHLIETIIKRREELFNLALVHLCSSEIEQLTRLGSAIDDSRSQATWEALNLAGVKLAPALDPTGISIYGKVYSKDLFLYLYSKGFLDVNAYDSSGNTPLMSWVLGNDATEGIGELLLQYGADPFKLHRQYRLNVLQLIMEPNWFMHPPIRSLQIGSLLSRSAPSRFLWARNSHSSGYELLKGLSRWILFNQHLKIPCLSYQTRLVLSATFPMWQDSCRCVCSPSGCTPMTTFVLQYLLKKFSKFSSDNKFLPKDVFNISQMLWTWYQGITAAGGNYETLRKELFRLLTFEHLEITHTCCQRPSRGRWPKPRMPQEDTHEIQEEESEFIQELERVVLNDISQSWIQSSIFAFLFEVNAESPPTLRRINPWWIRFCLGLDEVACERIRIACGISQNEFWECFWHSKEDWSRPLRERKVRSNRIDEAPRELVIRAALHKRSNFQEEEDHEYASKVRWNYGAVDCCVDFRSFRIQCEAGTTCAATFHGFHLYHCNESI